MRANVVFIADSLYDRDCGTSDWVHLCFHPNQPMFYQKISAKDREEFVVLDVSLEVALWDSAVFSDEYATATRARLGPRFSDLQKLNLECFASGMFTSTTKAAWQAEVLVHKSIPISAISRTRSYADVLKEHQSAVPAGAKMGFLSERAVGP